MGNGKEAHLSCSHLTQLRRKVALGELTQPVWNDPSLALLQERGKEHEKSYVEHLATEGRTLIDLTDKSFEETVKAMKEGVDVIVQARLQEGKWMGYADILIKVPQKSNLGDWSYEVQDTKLAQETRPGTILQLCLYSELLEKIQGIEVAALRFLDFRGPCKRGELVDVLIFQFNRHVDRLAVKKELDKFINKKLG